jgi:hypothetical protein
MAENPYQSPKPSDGSKAAATEEISQHVAFVLACCSFIVASCFVLVMVSSFFDATFSVFVPPWEDETGAALMISSWCTANFATWVATGLAALRRRTVSVIAALVADASVVLPMAVL